MKAKLNDETALYYTKDGRVVKVENTTPAEFLKKMQLDNTLKKGEFYRGGKVFVSTR